MATSEAEALAQKIADFIKAVGDPNQKIGRPRQIYTGEPMRDYTAIESREG